MILILMLFSGCVKEPTHINEESSTITLSIKSDAIGRTRSSGKTIDTDSEITSIRVFAFDDVNGVEHFDRQQLFEQASGDLTMTVREHHNKKLYVVVNEPNDQTVTSLLNAARSVANLKEINFSMASYFNNDLVNAFHMAGQASYFETLPMFGDSKFFDTKDNEPVKIEVRRSLAKVSVRLKVKGGDQVKNVVVVPGQSNFSYNTHGEGNLTGEAVSPTNTIVKSYTFPEASTEIKLDTTVFTPIFSLYTPARIYGNAPPLKIDIKGLKSDEIPSFDLSITLDNTYAVKPAITANAITELKANHEYKIDATINKQAGIDIETTIGSWDSDVIIGDIIPSAELKVPLEVRMDASISGSYKSGDIKYFGSDEVTLFVESKVGFGDYVELIDNNTLSENLPSWLTLATYSKSVDKKSGHFNFEYTIIDGIASKPPFRIKLVSGNITKIMSVIYDNKVYDLSPTVYKNTAGQVIIDASKMDPKDFTRAPKALTTSATNSTIADNNLEHLSSAASNEKVYYKFEVQKEDLGGNFSWERKLNDCRTLNIDGAIRWRLPTIKELTLMFRLKSDLMSFDVLINPATYGSATERNSDTYFTLDGSDSLLENYIKTKTGNAWKCIRDL